MSATQTSRTDPDPERLLAEIEHHLQTDVIPYWRNRAPDLVHGGFLTNFDSMGAPLPCPEKYLNTQCRIIWWFSVLARREPQSDYAVLAREGVDYLIRTFWDAASGGWYWKNRTNGDQLDPSKIVYGQSFAIYALSEYGVSVGDERGFDYAERTFDLLQKFATDTLNGGYIENFDRHWNPLNGELAGMDRKGIDTHMHLMEAFTGLYSASGREVHRTKLLQLIELIRLRMFDWHHGSGRNQMDAAWNPLPVVSIARTWNAERLGEGIPQSVDTTSYGHNVELSWLLHRALDVCRVNEERYAVMTKALMHHALRFGVDWACGGIYRDGLPEGPPVNLDKEFWQHAESLVGFIDAYQRFGDARFLEAAACVWRFTRDHLAQPAGEWRTLVSRDGLTIIDGNLGNPWKCPYHTGRALLESVDRLRAICHRSEPIAQLVKDD
jgi:mannobiose 2-epimerase